MTRIVEAFKNKQGEVSFYDPITNSYRWVSEKEVDEAINSGMVPEPYEQYQERMVKEEYEKPKYILPAIGAGVGRGVTLGLFEHMLPEEQKKHYARVAEGHPWASAGSEIAGNIASMAVGPLKAVEKGIGAVGGLARRGLGKAKAIGAVGKSSAGKTVKLYTQESLNEVAKKAAKKAAGDVGGLLKSAGATAKQVAAAESRVYSSQVSKRLAEEISARHPLTAKAITGAETLTTGMAQMGLIAGGTELSRQAHAGEKISLKKALKATGEGAMVGGAFTLAGGLLRGIAGVGGEKLMKKAGVNIKDFDKAQQSLKELKKIKRSRIKELKKTEMEWNRAYQSARTDMIADLEKAAASTGTLPGGIKISGAAPGGFEAEMKARIIQYADNELKKAKDILAPDVAAKINTIKSSLNLLEREVVSAKSKINVARTKYYAGLGSRIRSAHLAMGALSYHYSGQSILAGIAGFALGDIAPKILNTKFGKTLAGIIGKVGPTIGKTAKITAVNILSAQESADIKEEINSIDTEDMYLDALDGLKQILPENTAKDIADVEKNKILLIKNIANEPNTQENRLKLSKVLNSLDLRNIVGRIAENKVMKEDLLVLNTVYPEIAENLREEAQELLDNYRDELSLEQIELLEKLIGENNLGFFNMIQNVAYAKPQQTTMGSATPKRMARGQTPMNKQLGG